MKYLTILDFQYGQVHQYEIQEDQYPRHEDLEDFIASKGFSLGNIEWMSHYDKKIYIEHTDLCTEHREDNYIQNIENKTKNMHS